MREQIIRRWSIVIVFIALGSISCSFSEWDKEAQLNNAGVPSVVDKRISYPFGPDSPVYRVEILRSPTFQDYEQWNPNMDKTELNSNWKQLLDSDLIPNKNTMEGDCPDGICYRVNRTAIFKTVQSCWDEVKIGELLPDSCHWEPDKPNPYGNALLDEYLSDLQQSQVYP